MNPKVNLSPLLSYQNLPYVRQSLNQILLDLNATMKKPPLQMKHNVDGVVTKLARLRDYLIAEQRFRQDISFVQSPALKQINIALSLVINVDEVVTKLARLRDHLIGDQRFRQDISFVQSPALKQVNNALSLVISVGYPGGAIQRQALEEAHSLLQNFLRK